jgi:hypothetical protein
MSDADDFPTTPWESTPTNPDWRLDALCAQVAPDEWYFTHRDRAAGNGGLDDDDVMAICRQCDALPDCLTTALLNRESWGVWGATHPRHRREMITALHAGRTTVTELAAHLRVRPAQAVVHALRNRNQRTAA